MNFLDFKALEAVLPIIGQGLCGVFLVIGVLALTVALLNALTGKNKE